MTRAPARALRAFAAVAVLTAAALVGAGTTAAPANAVDPAQWQAGNIISDHVFYSPLAMSASQVEALFAANYRGCDAGYTCVRDYRMTTPTRPAEAGLCAGYRGASGELAAQVIANVAVSCGINPRVLVVLIQKESALLTDPAPDYTQVTGYGCPDTTGCDSTYFGFFNQVYLAARQFKLYRLNPTNYGYVAGRTNRILYDPDQSCGSSSVYIQNQATAALYDYTPYQPNAAALANLGGSGDQCSTYGNRNFWTLFTNWFGSTQGGSSLWGQFPDGTLSYYQNRSDLDPTGLPYSSGVTVRSDPTAYTTLTSGDVDGDGRPDLVGTRPDGTLWEIDNTTSGSAVQSFAPPVRIGQGWQGFSRLLLADVSGDGCADLLAVDASGTLWYFPNNSATNPGGLAFTYGVRMGNGWSAFPLLTAGDVDGDGRADVVGADASGVLWEYPNVLPTNSAQVPYGPRVAIGGGWTSFTALSARDVSADGVADLVATRSDGTLWYYPDNFGSNPGHVPFTTGTTIGRGWTVFSRVF